MQVRVYDINWDTDGVKEDITTETVIDIPEAIDLNDECELEAFISDELSNISGWCHLGFKYETILNHQKATPELRSLMAMESLQER